MEDDTEGRIKSSEDGTKSNGKYRIREPHRRQENGAINEDLLVLFQSCNGVEGAHDTCLDGFHNCYGPVTVVHQK